MTEFFVCFSCCIGEQPQPKRRRRIDRSMIGEPMNFQHTSHVGLGDEDSSYRSIEAYQERMRSKGGYENGVSARVQH